MYDRAQIYREGEGEAILRVIIVQAYDGTLWVVLRSVYNIVL